MEAIVSEAKKDKEVAKEQAKKDKEVAKEQAKKDKEVAKEQAKKDKEAAKEQAKKDKVVAIESETTESETIESVTIESVLEQKRFIQIINETYENYFKYGPHSPKKVDCFHNAIKKILERDFTCEKGYDIELEYNIESCNSSKKKRCDIVVLKNSIPYIIFPVKIIMTNYKQNKNNSWENLTGELIHIKWCNPNIHIIPINILMNKTPYLKKNKEIKTFESVKKSDIENYKQLINHNICYDIINYIVEVEHIKKETEVFDKIQLVEFIRPYRTFSSIIDKLL